MRSPSLTVVLALTAIVLATAPLHAQPTPEPSAPPQTESPLPSPTPALPPAGVLPPSVTVTVTGNPADAAFLLAQIIAALDRAIRPQLAAGATVRYGDPEPAPQPLSAGFQTSVTVPVTIAGDAQTSPVDGSVAVQVVNLSLQRQDPPLLALDDDPEYVRTDGVLFRTNVEPDRPLRLYTYHENVGQARRFVLTFSVAGAAPARVQVIDASAGPNVDVMSVGHAVSKAFVVVEPLNVGSVIDVSPNLPFVQRDVVVGPAQGVAAALEVRVLEGGPLTLTLMAIPSSADLATYLNAPKIQNDGHNRHGTFDLLTAGQATVAYTVGGPDASYEYGNRARSPRNVDPNDVGSDAGDYGVIQRIAFDLANPATTPATVFLYEEPVGGVVRNSFSIDGTLVDVGCARLSQRYQIASYQLAAQGTQTLHVVTMTDGGSNYPLQIGVSTTAPLPTTPPINAPDGCFPKPGFVPASPSAPPGSQTPAPPTPSPVATLPASVPPPPTPIPPVPT